MLLARGTLVLPVLLIALAPPLANRQPAAAPSAPLLARAQGGDDMSADLGAVGYVGADSYREGYSGGVINADLVQWKPEKGQIHYETGELVKEQVTIVESSRFDYPTRTDPVQSETINLAHFLIDDDLKTKWWSAIDEMEAWIEIDLGNPIVRITDDDSRWFFMWKYQDQIDAAWDIPYLDGGLIGFHIDEVIIYWSEMYASSDYKIQSSIDKIQWKDRAVKLNMPNVYDRVDSIQGWSSQGVGNTRYIRITMVERGYAKTAWGMRTSEALENEDPLGGAQVPAGNRRRLLFSDSVRRWGRNLLQYITRDEQGNIGRDRDGGVSTERTVYGIREIKLIGPEPSQAGGRGNVLVPAAIWLTILVIILT
eukprot:g3552.t1